MILLGIKHHTVPHLKGLNSGLEPSHGRGSKSMGSMLAQKVLILHHREANERFVLLSIVGFLSHLLDQVEPFCELPWTGIIGKT